MSLVCLLLLVLLASPALAEPKLVCDVPVWVVASAEIEITWNCQASISKVTPTVSGEDYALMDLSALEPGLYTFRARFLDGAGVPTEWSSPMLRVIRHALAWSARNYSAAAMDGF